MKHKVDMTVDIAVQMFPGWLNNPEIISVALNLQHLPDKNLRFIHECLVKFRRSEIIDEDKSENTESPKLNSRYDFAKGFNRN